MKPLHHPDEQSIQLSSVLYALSDPIRLYLVSTINRVGEKSCGDIAVPVVKSTVSHHVRTLREAGVVRVRTQGTQRYVSLRREELDNRFPGLLASILDAYEPPEELARQMEF